MIHFLNHLNKMNLLPSPEQVTVKKPEDIKVKITLKALVRILIRYSSRSHLLETCFAKSSNSLILMIRRSDQYHGACYYDLAEQCAWHISLRWISIIEEERL